MPIVLHEGKILDAQGPYTACVEPGIEPPTRGFDGDDPLGFVLSTDLHRRHRTESQRAMVAVEEKKMHEADALRRRIAGVGQDENLQANLPESSKGHSRDIAAKRVNVSPRTVQAAAKVKAGGRPRLAMANLSAASSSAQLW
jgi:hypothetical protein